MSKKTNISLYGLAQQYVEFLPKESQTCIALTIDRIITKSKYRLSSAGVSKLSADITAEPKLAYSMTHIPK